MNFFSMDKWWQSPLFFIQENPVSLFTLLGALVLAIASCFIAKWVRLSIPRLPLFKRYFSPSACYGLGRLIYYAILLLGFYLALTTLGIDLTGIAILVGAFSVGIGFGLQAIFNNLIAGMIVLAEKKVRVGDQIEIDSGEVGTVLEINVRSTLIKTFDHRKVVIPNTVIISKQLINWTLGKDGLCRLQIPFSITRTVNREKVQRLALEAADQVPFTAKDPKAVVWLVKLSTEIASFELVVWVDMRERAQITTSYLAEYIWTLATVFEREKLSLHSIERPTNHIAAKRGL